MKNFFKKSEIDKIVSLAMEAGELAKKAFVSRNFEVRKKSDNSKVTSADVEISKFLQQNLNQEFPQIQVVCEENDLRKITAETFFIIDPIDGTSSFAAGSSEFSINIALIKNQKAVFGLIYAPSFEGGKMIFCDEKNQIVKRVIDQKKESILLKSDFEILPLVPLNSKIRVITSVRSKELDVQNYVEQFYPNFIENNVIERLSSAVKFFRILEGDADLYLHFRQSMEWDTAAGQALVECLGGKVKKLLFNENFSQKNNRSHFKIGEELSYKKHDFKNSAFVIDAKDFFKN